MTMKHTIAALCLVVGCIVALGFSTQPPAAVAVEPIQIVRPVPKAERCTNKDCVCLDCKCDPCKCKVEFTNVSTMPLVYAPLKPTDTEWSPFAVYLDSEDKPSTRPSTCVSTNCKRCYYKDTEWLWYGGKLWELKGGKFIEFHEPARAAATNSLVSRRTSTKGESGSCSSGGCSSGSCGVGRGRLGRWR